MKTITLEGIPIEVERKPIRNLYLRVHSPDGRVRLTAPLHVSTDAIEQFAASRLGWIRKHLAAAKGASQPALLEDGAQVLLWGSDCRLDLTEGSDCKRIQIIQTGAAINMKTPIGVEEAARQAALNAWYRRQLQAAITRQVPPREAVVGVHASAWRIRDMTSRWGTCQTQTGVITLNLQLVKRKPAYLDYVITHELTHLLEPSHNARFYALMDEFYPGWRQMRALLNARIPE